MSQNGQNLALYCHSYLNLNKSHGNVMSELTCAWQKAENNVIYGLVHLSSLNPRHSKKRLDMRSYIPGNEANLYASYVHVYTVQLNMQ